ncbi:posphoenolpyruvate synthetase regulatory kinase/phosphorylase PpsR [Mycobacterium talmoniae]|uniref:Putative phosphoenolpyruvate synthase regulatory protein n=1 Tax=Mycobacterium talmoniae TaxID=1858794 RepID=A0A1S1NQI6_9MYCO|nr:MULTISPECIES: pyruvate, water dikinase regulatory protein [Mycobacterium]OHV06806.1 phosphoenolpyruvate synthase regulatory protein [Mycobacterium talmoniae]PQM45967.1 Phosphoenolpyruvate synthase regulatory protein [Mycobacterium talmoniae]TDH56380.1 kinase/pyrophosphorylase [Mycobacterium eburneum]
MQRTVFFISDSTGITAETIGNSILAQFEGVQFEKHRLPFIDDVRKAESAAARIKTRYEQTGTRPIVVNTMADRSLGEIVAASGGLMLDVFAPFLGSLEDELGTKHSGAVNRSHGLVDFEKYEARMNATNYALAHDDGIDVDYSQADLILVGVSRSGKTPTCLYMALHYGVSAANYPLIDDDLHKLELPAHLRPYRDRLCGLTIDAQRLAQIREQRRPGSRYADLQQCRWELQQADRLLQQERIPCLNTTHVSIEEIASKIFDRFGIERTMF